MNRLAILLLAGACTTAQAASLTPLPEREFNAAALRAESQLRLQMNQPLRVAFHRRQGFRWQGEGRRTATVVSLMALPEGGPARCVLAVERRGQLQVLDALATDAGQPWACDGEPALSLADVDGDGASDLLALYPFRPPSNEVFQLPLVLHHRPDKGDFELDSARTRWLRDSGQLPATVQQMKQQLQRFQP
jgi:hypothetical protein